MAKRVALLVGLSALILMVLPGFSDGPPKQATDQPEFYFTRLMYTDIRGHGPTPGQQIPTDFEHGHSLGDRLSGYFGAWLTDTWDADYQYMWGIQRLTNARISMKPHPIEIMDPELFS